MESKELLAFNHKSQPFILLISIKMPIWYQLIFMSRIYFMLSRVDNEKWALYLRLWASWNFSLSHWLQYQMKV